MLDSRSIYKARVDASILFINEHLADRFLMSNVPKVVEPSGRCLGAL